MCEQVAGPVETPGQFTNARTEAANTSIKQIERNGRGYRHPAHYKARIRLASAARRAA